MSLGAAPPAPPATAGAAAAGSGGASVSGEVRSLPDLLAQRLAQATRPIAVPGTVIASDAGQAVLRTQFGPLTFRSAEALPLGARVTVNLPPPSRPISPAALSVRPMPAQILGLPGPAAPPAAGGLGGLATAGLPAGPMAAMPALPAGLASPLAGLTGLLSQPGAAPALRAAGPTGAAPTPALPGAPASAAGLPSPTGSGPMTAGPAALPGGAPGAGAPASAGAATANPTATPSAGATAEATQTGGQPPATAARPGGPPAPTPTPAGQATAAPAPAAAPAAPQPAPGPASRAVPVQGQATGGAPVSTAATTAGTPATTPATASTIVARATAPLPYGTSAPASAGPAGAATGPTGIAAAGTGDANPMPGLREALAALSQSDPGLASRTAQTTVLQPTPQLGGTLIFLMSALQGGDVRHLIGDRAQRVLEATGRADVLARIGRDLAGAVQTTRDAAGGEWRSFQLPVFHGQGWSTLTLSVPRVRRDAGAAAPADRPGGRRFLVDVTLSQVGPVQLDGVLRPRLLDVALRSRHRFTGEERQEIQSLYAAALATGGLGGTLTLATGAEGWVRLARSGR